MARLGNYIRQVRGVSYKPGDLFDGPSPDAITVLRANNITDSGEITLDDVVLLNNAFSLSMLRPVEKFL